MGLVTSSRPHQGGTKLTIAGASEANRATACDLPQPQGSALPADLRACYSDRMLTVGATWAARRAGTIHAAKAVASRNSVTPI